MENSQHIKSLNTDARGKNRIRYASARERAKRASADIYRSYRRRIGVTSAATREERVHHHSEESRRKRQKTTRVVSDDSSRVAIVSTTATESDYDSTILVGDDTVDESSTFAEELDLAHERNASNLFGRFYRSVWPLVRSLPEVLHHAPTIMDFCMSYLLSPVSDRCGPSPGPWVVQEDEATRNSRKRQGFVINLATADVLHLLSVLAKELRHEIHIYVHSLIVPRIVYNLLNPQPLSEKQPVPLDVTIVETAFRTLSYVFRYDTIIFEETVNKEEDPCLELMRQYYGATLAHNRDYVRRLAAETFSPLVRKLSSESARKRHLKRVIRALATAVSQQTRQRLVSNAIDGVSLLLYYTARGIPGQLHSKGHIAVKSILDCVTSNAKHDQTSNDVVYAIAKSFFEKLFLQVSDLELVWKELLKSTDVPLSKLKHSETETLDINVVQAFSHMLQLMEQSVSFRDGFFLRSKSSGQRTLNKFVILLERVFLNETCSVYDRLSPSVQTVTWGLLCSIWKAIPDQNNSLRLCRFLPSVLGKTGREGCTQQVQSAAHFLANRLLPHLPRGLAMKHVGSAVLTAAAQLKQDDTARSLVLIHSVATCRLLPSGSDEKQDESDGDDDDDRIFFVENSTDCDLFPDHQSVLLDLCLMDTFPNRENLAKLGYACRCVPFVALVGKRSPQGNERIIKRITKWFAATLKQLDDILISDASKNGNYEIADTDVLITKALVLESIATIATEYGRKLEDTSLLKKLLSRARPSVMRLIVSHPSSIWAVKSVAAYVQALAEHHLELNDSPDEVMDILIPNLRQKSHFLRLHTLQILNSYPPKPFVTDHASLDLTDDLDEEPSVRPENRVGKAWGTSHSLVGPCDILKTLLSLESLPVNIHSERRLTSLITRVEVLGRTGRLPVAYAEAASNHMFGILYTKFSPLWPVAVRALRALASSHEDSAWPSLEAMLQKVVVPYCGERNCLYTVEGGPSTESAYVRHHLRCVAWDETDGTDAGLFASQVNAAKKVGRVSRHLHTDSSTIFELVWSVIEGVPQVTTKKSKVVVPIFLKFLHLQYFLFHQNDPDAREFRLEEHVRETASWTREELQRKDLQRKLSSFLRMFAAVNGPQQLYKHSYLQSIFSAFLSHQDARTAQLALSCILKFKLPQVMPYTDHLQAMLKKGELRESLVKFDISKGSGIVEKDHRDILVALVSRILFGRLTARVSGGKSSKDNPSARRAAVLSFLSVLGDGPDLDPFMYLMLRSFVPVDTPMKPIENQTDDDRAKLLIALQSMKAKGICEIHQQRQEGFLNLLSDVIAQLGYGVKKYVSTFISIVLSLCEFSEVGKGHSTQGGHDEGEVGNARARRIGIVRTLCYRRIEELMAQYASFHDFSKYSKRMWGTVAASVQMLPGAVVNAEKPPALLVLLVTISSHCRLIPMLSEHSAAVEAVIKCIASTSRDQIVDASLRFVDNLLNDGGAAEHNIEVRYDSEGVELIRKHIPLLMKQFACRIQLDSGGLHGSAARKSQRANQSTWRELAILCRVSEIIVHDDALLSEKGDERLETSDIFASLCELLIPFLGHDQRANEDGQLNVLSILNSILPRVESSIARSHLVSLSRVLGPHKSGKGIASLLVRQRAATVIATIADCDKANVNLKLASTVLDKLCSTNAKRVDEADYDQLVPALNALSETTGTSLNWVRLAGVNLEQSRTSEIPHLSPLIQTCVYFLFDDDGVVSRGAFKALKTLILEASQQAALEVTGVAAIQEESRQSPWVLLVEKSIVPFLRPGLSTSSHQVRRFFILLLAEVAHSFEGHASPNLYGDLGCLVRADDSDLDFFKNITHVQIHRRCRALQRLRKMLTDDSTESSESLFTMHSLSNVLLPLAMHPVYECKSRAEEAYALEAIATIGAIGSLLSWNKYNNALWTALIQFPRHPEQERYLVGMICSLIDGFHFQVVRLKNTEEGSLSDNATDQVALSAEQGSAVWRALDRRLIPKIESYLTKEKVDRSGAKIKTLRSPVVLALLKLFRKFPEALFETKLPRLLAVICDALKNRDSDVRDAARTTLAKMAVEVDMKYLLDIIRELAVTLTEGYQLHVRSAAIHSILLEVSKKYCPPKSNSQEVVPLPFDRCLPALMDLIQQDLFGEATERKEVEGVQKRVVKEASGSKSVDSIELICRLLLFRPSLVTEAPSNPSVMDMSSVHVVVTPLLNRLRGNDVKRTIGKVRECLNRVVVGLSHNSSAEAGEILPFVYASIEPFIREYRVVVMEEGDRLSDEDCDDSDDDSGVKPISVSRTGTQDTPASRQGSKIRKTASTSVVEWRPSTLNAVSTGRDALGLKARERKELSMVQDGASAPRLTGSSRYASMAKVTGGRLDDPAGVSAVVFGLSLLHSVLRRTKKDSEDARLLSMMDGFIPMLTTCVCVCRDNDVILLSLKCLGSLLSVDLPSVPICSTKLGTKALDLLTSSGALSNLHHELTQGCFKTLTLLLNMDRNSTNNSPGGVKRNMSDLINEGEHALSKSSRMPLDINQMQVLISLLQASVVETDHHNATFSLIKAIASRRFVSAEFYDLMETLLRLSVRSQKPTVRQQSSQIFLNYLVEYPMGKQRLEGHLKQMVLNIKYEYEDGRRSAIGLVSAVVEKLPLPLLEEKAQLLFLPLVLQLVNDGSKDCREAVAKCLSRMLSRVSVDVVQTLYYYAVKWSSQGAVSLQRTSLQLFGIFVNARLDFIKRGNVAQELLNRIYAHLKSSGPEGLNDWEVSYFALMCLEKLIEPFPLVISQHTNLWMMIVDCIVNPHPWVKQVASRMLADHLLAMTATAFVEENADTFIKHSGSLFKLAQNLCFQLNVPESEQNQEISSMAIKSLTWVVQAMDKYPHLCFAEAGQDSDEDGGPNEKKSPVAWLMTRLSNMAKPKGEKRRQAIFKCFAAFTTVAGSKIVSPYLGLMLEPLHRCIVETDNATENASIFRKRTVTSEEGDMAKDVLQLLEEHCGTEGFLEAYASVKVRAREKREARKQKLAAEAVLDPQAAAARKMRKHQSERKRRKRQVEQRRVQRGGTSKRRHT